MSFPGSQAYAHATIKVSDLGAARSFFTDVLGLSEIAASEDTVYLGCDGRGSYDLALRGGGTGVEHFALRVPAREHLDRAAAELSAIGIASERRHDAEPGEREALRFELPSGHVAELIVAAEAGYLETYREPWAAAGHAPLDGDHINLMATDVRTVSELLCNTLGFRCADLTEDPQGEGWRASWLRLGPGHHDVGISAGRPGESLHHVAFAYASIDHLKLALDRLAATGYGLELGLGRHPVGANLFAYLWSPGGNRIELCAEGAILADDAPTRRWTDMSETLNAWSDAPPPPTFAGGS